ncbi:MAG: glycosyltransferase [Lachnospiraceae bacterium]|nr:glycosyltransferase [Lachnospiraceae bacterium]
MIICEKEIEQMLKALKGEGKIYCFGAGDFGKKFLKDAECGELVKHVKAFADNDIKKNGKSLSNTEYSYPIISLECLLNDIRDQDIIIITCKNYMPILEQLIQIKKLNSVNCYVYTMVKDYCYDKQVEKIFCPDEFKLISEPIIPKVIHYCWFGGNKLTERHLKCLESWKIYCPDYEIIEWNEQNYDIHKNKFVEQAYQAKKWAFVSDYARLDIIFHHGGVYLDTDVEIIKPIDELLFQEAFCGFQNESEINFGLGFGSVKNNEIIKKIMKRYLNMNFFRQDGTMDLTPCPVIQSSILQECGAHLDGTYQVLPNITVYPEKVLSGKSQKTRRIHITEQTYAIHHFDASWMEQNDYTHRKLRDQQIEKYFKMLNASNGESLWNI